MATLGGQLTWNKPEATAEGLKMPRELVVREISQNPSGKILELVLRLEVRV